MGFLIFVAGLVIGVGVGFWFGGTARGAALNLRIERLLDRFFGA